MATNREQPIPLPSDRSFGITFAVVFALVAVWLWWKNISGATVLASLAVAFLVISFARPGILHPLNRAWMAFGGFLHRIVSPVILGAIYFGMFTPIAFVMRVRGRDVMHRRSDPQAASYWIRRDPPGPAPDSLDKQF